MLRLHIDSSTTIVYIHAYNIYIINIRIIHAYINIYSDGRAKKLIISMAHKMTHNSFKKDRKCYCKDFNAEVHDA